MPGESLCVDASVKHAICAAHCTIPAVKRHNFTVAPLLVLWWPRPAETINNSGSKSLSQGQDGVGECLTALVHVILSIGDLLIPMHFITFSRMFCLLLNSIYGGVSV